jgi:hypothetical protein
MLSCPFRTRSTGSSKTNGGLNPLESPTVKLFRVSDRRLAGEIRVGHLNPQTQEFSM